MWVWERAEGEEEDEEEYVDLNVVVFFWTLAGRQGRSMAVLQRPTHCSCSYDGTMKLWRRPQAADDWHRVQTLHHGALGTVWDGPLSHPRREHRGRVPVRHCMSQARALGRQSTRRAGIESLR